MHTRSEPEIYEMLDAFCDQVCSILYISLKPKESLLANSFPVRMENTVILLGMLALCWQTTK